MKKLILAVIYSDGLAADRFLASLGYKLRDEGVKVAGLVQRNTFVRDRTKCDMEIEELSSGEVFQISEDRGGSANGCRLDRDVLARAAATMDRVLDEHPEMLILNKFGKVEAEGGGLRDTLVTAVQSEIPIIVGIPVRNIDQWRTFAGGMAEEVGLSITDVVAWLKRFVCGVQDREGDMHNSGQNEAFAFPVSNGTLSY